MNGEAVHAAYLSAGMVERLSGMVPERLFRSTRRVSSAVSAETAAGMLPTSLLTRKTSKLRQP
jgi:hypothetical protein